MSALLAIGDLRFEVDDLGIFTPEGIGWTVTISSSRKVDEKAAEGQDDATSTRKGREVRKVTIKLSCGSEPEDLERLRPIVEALDPSNPKPGDPPAFAYEFNGLDVSKAKNVRAIEIKEAKGPDFAETGVTTYELTCSSWAKPTPSAGAGTAKGSQKFVLGSETKQTVPNFGGVPGNKVTFPANTPPAPTTPKP